jgi:hypothetical protein
MIRQKSDVIEPNYDTLPLWCDCLVGGGGFNNRSIEFLHDLTSEWFHGDLHTIYSLLVSSAV